MRNIQTMEGRDGVDSILFHPGLSNELLQNNLQISLLKEVQLIQSNQSRSRENFGIIGTNLREKLLISDGGK